MNGTFLLVFALLFTNGMTSSSSEKKITINHVEATLIEHIDRYIQEKRCLTKDEIQSRSDLKYYYDDTTIQEHDEENPCLYLHHIRSYSNIDAYFEKYERHPFDFIDIYVKMFDEEYFFGNRVDILKSLHPFLELCERGEYVYSNYYTLKKPPLGNGMRSYESYALLTIGSTDDDDHVMHMHMKELAQTLHRAGVPID